MPHPPFGIRFYANGRLACAFSVCWHCNNAFGRLGEDRAAFEFDASAPAARELLAAAQRVTGVRVADDRA